MNSSDANAKAIDTGSRAGGSASATRALGGRVSWFFGPDGAHVRFPGFRYGRNSGPAGWSKNRTWRLLGLVCIWHIDTQRGALKSVKAAGWHVRFARLVVRANFDKASNNAW